jgi:hypothetical protein
MYPPTISIKLLPPHSQAHTQTSTHIHTHTHREKKTWRAAKIGKVCVCVCVCVCVIWMPSVVLTRGTLKTHLDTYTLQDDLLSQQEIPLHHLAAYTHQAHSCPPSTIIATKVCICAYLYMCICVCMCRCVCVCMHVTVCVCNVCVSL